MAIRRKKQEEAVSFQITPMIDMTFLLLIFFMVTSKLSKEQVKLDIKLPTASAATIPDDLSNRDIINVDGEGQFYVANDPVTEEQLEAHLKARFAANPPLKIYYRADRETPYEVTDKFMSMAADAGAIQVLFGTYRK
jgi:biopolymer transport protein ExbD